MPIDTAIARGKWWASSKNQGAVIQAGIEVTVSALTANTCTVALRRTRNKER